LGTPLSRAEKAAGTATGKIFVMADLSPRLVRLKGRNVTLQSSRDPIAMLLRFCTLIVLVLAMAAPARAEDPAPAEVEKIQKIVHDYLQQHPEVVIDALQEYQKAQDAKKADQARQTIAAVRDDLLKDTSNPEAGNPKGDVTIVEFFDYRCPYCKAVSPDLQKALSADGNVRLIYKEFPILGPESIVASKAALAAMAQQKYQPFHDKLISFKGNLDDAAIYSLAADAGLDVTRLKADMDKPEIKDQIARNYRLADKLNIQGTPAFVIGDTLLPGAASYDDFTAAFKHARGS
jgi:protein-disulfide isomerase